MSDVLKFPRISLRPVIADESYTKLKINISEGYLHKLIFRYYLNPDADGEYIYWSIHPSKDTISAVTQSHEKSIDFDIIEKTKLVAGGGESIIEAYKESRRTYMLDNIKITKDNPLSITIYHSLGLAQGYLVTLIYSDRPYNVIQIG